jgi:hypothetical protein
MQAAQEVEMTIVQAGEDAELRYTKLAQEVEELKVANQRYLAMGVAWKKRFEATQALLAKTMEENANELKTLHDLLTARQSSGVAI